MIDSSRFAELLKLLSDNGYDVTDARAGEEDPGITTVNIEIKL